MSPRRGTAAAAAQAAARSAVNAIAAWRVASRRTLVPAARQPLAPAAGGEDPPADPATAVFLVCLRNSQAMNRSG